MKGSMKSRSQVLIDAYESARGEFLRRFLAAGRKHINDFLNLKCAPDMLERGLFPNAKEITESNAAYHATRYLPGYDLNDGDVRLIAVGDGTTPRTAAMFAFRSKWQCLSIDPGLRKTEWRTDRLYCIPKKIEDVRPLCWMAPCERAVIVAVHSHAKLQDSLRIVNAKHLAVIAIPCCVPQRLRGPDGDVKPDRRYRDTGIWSPKNEVLIWNDVVGLVAEERSK